MKGVFKQVFILAFAAIFAVALIFASGPLVNVKNSLFAALGKSDQKSDLLCPSDMIAVPTSQGVLCVDKYEVSASDRCVSAEPKTPQETTSNVAWPECKPASVSGKLPWTNVAFHQAQTLCARAGKRLPSAEEWYQAALGTPDNYGKGVDACNINRIGKTEPDKTGNSPTCISSSGVYDMVGNVWEWVDESVSDGKYQNRTLPDEGYVSGVDKGGIPTATLPDAPDASFGGDYFWVDKTETRGMFRGGFWGIGDKVGLYAVNVTVPTSFTGVGVGFRCVK